MGESSVADSVDFQFVYDFIDQLRPDARAVELGYLGNLHPRGCTGGAGSITDSSRQTEDPNLILVVDYVQCRWQWMVSTVLVSCACLLYTSPSPRD